MNSPKFNRQSFVLYLAVLPEYRQRLVSNLDRRLGGSISYYACEAHLEQSVKTKITSDNFASVAMWRIGDKRAFLQYGHVMDAIWARSLVIDLNPRSLTAWWLLIARRVLRQRTVVWGHLYPAKGAGSSTAMLRRWMRTLSNGLVCYSYRQGEAAVLEVPGKSCWVAPNALYDREEMGFLEGRSRTKIVYVGRLVPEKKVELLVLAAAELVKRGREVEVLIVGDGSERDALERSARDLDLGESVKFLGWVSSPNELRELYGEASCSVSPGYAGLSLTQSLGFGVPVVVANGEDHSPEIELESTGGVRYFTSDDALSMADKIAEIIDAKDVVANGRRYAEAVVERYSAEVMADGLIRAMTNDGSVRA